MATTYVSASENSAGITNFASGAITGDGNTIQINLGFKPRYFELINETDGIIWRKHVNQVAANAVKIVLGGTPALTLDTGSHVLFGGSSPSDNGYITLDTTAVPNAKACSWVAFG